MKDRGSDGGAKGVDVWIQGFEMIIPFSAIINILTFLLALLVNRARFPWANSLPDLQGSVSVTFFLVATLDTSIAFLQLVQAGIDARGFAFGHDLLST